MCNYKSAVNDLMKAFALNATQQSPNDLKFVRVVKFNMEKYDCLLVCYVVCHDCYVVIRNYV